MFLFILYSNILSVLFVFLNIHDITACERYYSLCISLNNKFFFFFNVIQIDGYGFSSGGSDGKESNCIVGYPGSILG